MNEQEATKNIILDFVKTYVEEDGERLRIRISESQVKEDLDGSYKDVEAVIELLKENPAKKFARTLWAVFEYRPIEESKVCSICDGTGRDPEGEHYEGSASRLCPKCKGTGESE